MNNLIGNTTARNTVASPVNSQSTLSPIQAQTTEVVTMKHLIGTAAITVVIVLATVVAGLFDVQQMIQSAQVSQEMFNNINDTMLIASDGDWTGG